MDMTVVIPNLIHKMVVDNVIEQIAFLVVAILNPRWRPSSIQDGGHLQIQDGGRHDIFDYTICIPDPDNGYIAAGILFL